MSPATAELDLRDIQGNVLQGYGLRFAHYLFVRVVDRREGSTFVQELADQVTDIDRQPRLELAVGEAARLLAAHEATHLLEASAARAEVIVGTAGRHGDLLGSVVSYSVNAVGSQAVDAREARCEEKTR
jgi:hypothetical protein